MKPFSEKAIKAAMMEEICSGQEGHAPVDFDPPGESEFVGYVTIKCKKCRRVIEISTMALARLDGVDLDEPKEVEYVYDFPDPRATP